MVAHIFTLLLAPFASKLVNFLRLSESLKNVWKRSNHCFRRKMSSISNFFRKFKVSLRLEYLTNLDAKRAKRSIFKVSLKAHLLCIIFNSEQRKSSQWKNGRLFSPLLSSTAKAAQFRAAMLGQHCPGSSRRRLWRLMPPLPYRTEFLLERPLWMALILGTFRNGAENGLGRILSTKSEFKGVYPWFLTWLPPASRVGDDHRAAECCGTERCARIALTLRSRERRAQEMSAFKKRPLHCCCCCCCAPMCY